MNADKLVQVITGRSHSERLQQPLLSSRRRRAHGSADRQTTKQTKCRSSEQQHTRVNSETVRVKGALKDTVTPDPRSRRLHLLN